MKIILNLISPVLISAIIYNVGRFEEKYKSEKKVYGNYL